MALFLLSETGKRAPEFLLKLTKSLHFVVDYAVKPAVKEIIKSLEKICLQLKAQNQKQKEKVKTGKMPVKKLIKQCKGAQKIELDGEDTSIVGTMERIKMFLYVVIIPSHLSERFVLQAIGLMRILCLISSDRR